MSTRAETLGFTNEWYGEAFRHSHQVSLGDDVLINVADAPYFIATKMSALYNRGIADLRTSSDFEDIVYVLRNRSVVVSEIQAAATTTRDYLVTSFRRLLSMDILDEAIASVLDYGEPAGTHARIRSIMHQISSSENF
jgi:predicted nucleotidyltransferase